MKAVSTDARDRLRLLDARLDELVARAVELSVSGSASADLRAGRRRRQPGQRDGVAPPGARGGEPGRRRGRGRLAPGVAEPVTDDGAERPATPPRRQRLGRVWARCCRGLTGLLRVIVFGIVIGQNALADAYDGANNSPNSIYELLIGGVLSATLVPLFTAQLEDDDEEATTRSSPSSVDRPGRAHRGRRRRRAAHLPAVLAVAVGRGRRRASTARVGTRAGPDLPAPDLLLRADGARLGAAAGPAALLRPGVGAGAQQPRHHRLPARRAGVARRRAIPRSALADDRRRLPPAAQPRRHGRHRGDGRGARAGARSGPACACGSARPGATRRCASCWPCRAGRSATCSPTRSALIVVKNLARPGSGGQDAYSKAFMFFQLPHGLLAVSITTTFVPDLARFVARKDKAGVHRPRRRSGVRLVALLHLPGLARPPRAGAGRSSAAFLQHGEFSEQAARHAPAGALAGFSLGLVGFSVYLFVLRGFYAHQDTRTPFVINLVENAAQHRPRGRCSSAARRARARPRLRPRLPAERGVGAAGPVVQGARLRAATDRRQPGPDAAGVVADGRARLVREPGSSAATAASAPSVRVARPAPWSASRSTSACWRSSRSPELGARRAPVGRP